MPEEAPKAKKATQPVSVDEDGTDDELDDFREGQQDSENYIDGVFIPPPPAPPGFSGESTGVRLVIEFIENENFKSYAGIKLLGPFHKSFTSIVGPNGSGKSNVIDSMLFVFGYRATKLRSKKLSVLIHNSDGYKNCTYCKVTVHFCLIDDRGDDEFNKVPGSEFSVCRTAHKDNSSYYEMTVRSADQEYIKRRVKFQEVGKKLSEHGIDLRYSRFLILQGEVEQISLMKPKAENEGDAGFLEFLEEIIGSNRLKEPIEKLQAKVQETNEMRIEKFNRFRVIEAEKKALEQARNEAIAYLEMDNEKTITQHQLYQHQKHQTSKHHNQAKQVFDEFEIKFNEANEKVVKAQTERTQKENELTDLNKALQDICSDAEKANEDFKKIEREDINVRAQIKNSKERGKKLVKEIEETRANLDELKDMPDKLEAERKIQEEKQARLESELKEAEEKLTVAMNSIQEDTKVLQAEKNKKETELLQFQKAVDEDEGKLNIESSKLSLLKNKEMNERNRLESLQSKKKQQEQDIKSKLEKIDSFKDMIPDTQEKIKQVEQDIETDQRCLNDLQEQNYGLNQKLAELRASNSDQTSRNRVVNFLMQEKAKGRLNGIYGRMGDLGGIDSKYDCAISTAVGQLDHILVENVDCATEAIKALKAHNIGSASFIAKDKQDHFKSNCNSPKRTPEDAPRMLDLIKLQNEDFRPAFYYVMRDLLVANDIDQASRIGFGRVDGKRHRVVTLDGKIVEPSGAMSGGGRPIKGRMGSSALVSDNSANEKEIQSLDARIRENMQLIDQLRAKTDSKRLERKQLETDLDMMTKNTQKFRNELEILNADLRVCEEQIANQRKQVESLDTSTNQIKELEKCVQQLTEVYDRSKMKANKVEEIVKELDGKIQAIIDKKVGSVKTSIDNMRKELNTTKRILDKNAATMNSNARNIEKCEQKIKDLDDKIDECHVKIKEMKEKMDEMKEQGLKITEIYKELVAKRDQAEADVKQKEGEISDLKKQENRLNMSNVDLKFERDKLQEKLTAAQHQLDAWDRKLSTLTLHVIDNKVPSEFKMLSEEELQDLNQNYLSKQIQSLQNELDKSKPNLAAIDKYREVETVYIQRANELEAITNLREQRKANFERLKDQRFNEFKDGFQIISRKLKEMYRMITLGGDAELEWQDSLDPFSEGINFTVRPNKKSWKAITNLSGGEKTLSSLSLIFALHYFKPSPLYVMDEIDAALDFRNVSIIANYIKQRTRNTQFIIISLRNDMYEVANRLIGIHKINNCTRAITFNPSGIEEPDVVKELKKKYTKTKAQMAC